MNIKWPIFVLFFALSPMTLACVLGDSASCKDGLVCMNTEVESKPTCRPTPSVSDIKFDFPIYADAEVVCTHSYGVGSHPWPNAFYALDLTTPYNKPPSIVLAAADGKAFVFQGENGKPCPQPPGNPQSATTDACGSGWGNHIKVLHQKGLYSFYVHLEKTLVSNGESVKKGQPIGIEGWAGLAGHRHLRWSVMRLPGSSQEECEKKITWDGESVPFEFDAYVNGKRRTVNTATFNCPHGNIGAFPVSKQPRLRALK